MSESAASFRPLSGAEEFDRRVRSLAQASTPHADALAELARLVGQQDPFGTPKARAVSALPAAPSEPEIDFAAFDAELRGAIDAAPEKGLVPAAPRPGAGWERAEPRFPSASIREPRLPEQNPDLWAQGVDAADPVATPTLTASRDGGAPEPVESGSAKRTLVVLAAVVALTAGGLGASFLARSSSSSSVAATTSTPTIMAATGPSKVQPEPAATGADAPSEPSTLLDKNNSDGTATAKVVNSVEQPVDLAQAIKPSTADTADAVAAAVSGPTLPAAPPGQFAIEPRKVKTVLVRPDGTIIGDTPASAASAPPSAESQQASLVFDPKTALPLPSSASNAAPASAGPVPDAPKPAAAAAKPGAKSTARVTAPKPAATTTQDASAQGRTTVATPKTKPVAHAPAKPKPEVADATPTGTATADAAPATAARGGGFAIQLGAAASEAEGRAAANRLGQKYAGELGGGHPSVFKAEAGGKTVYRIRVGNLSQEAAKALCVKVQANGGGCFVARN